MHRVPDFIAVGAEHRLRRLRGSLRIFFRNKIQTCRKLALLKRSVELDKKEAICLQMTNLNLKNISRT